MTDGTWKGSQCSTECHREYRRKAEELAAKMPTAHLRFLASFASDLFHEVTVHGMTEAEFLDAFGEIARQGELLPNRERTPPGTHSKFAEARP